MASIKKLYKVSIMSQVIQLNIVDITVTNRFTDCIYFIYKLIRYQSYSMINSPGPAVTQATPTVPDRRATASAANTALTLKKNQLDFTKFLIS